ncbi:hypothetical protein E1B28_006950 [Marasmius oreades]|uniref:F-box domain-containing protein n=1 Tax=Marasmius oreades TaxID=181124 RepID=A0A9P7S0U1_9AGAR|nr:uncharacterized protein E1B28_006950 [Marasmius oreades]KAG7093267.1 hypothetical protein E1B28_006950 [Marasmius oreades]
MSRQQSNDILTHRDVHGRILCQRCHDVVALPNGIRPFHTIEPRFLRSDYVPSDIEISQLTDVIRRVPAEIWEMNFSTLCLSLCEYSLDDDCEDYPLLGLPATIISQVCSHWRIIAKGFPKLWSSINVNLSNPPYNVGLPLEVYFSNSGDYPLKLRIQSDGPILKSSWGLYLWESLSRHIHRSRELIMAMDANRADIEFLPPVPRLTFPNLESYREECPPPDELAWPWFWQAIQKSTKLAVVSTFFVNRAIPFSQLTTWEIRCIHRFKDVDDFLDVARSCKALQSLTLSGSRKLPGTGDNLPVVVREVNLPSLRNLSICTYQDHYWLPSIFGSLVMPSLETRSFRHCAWHLPSALVDMVRRSSISLKQIRLTLMEGWRANSSGDPLLLDMLQAVPKLTSFELTLGGVATTKIRHYTTFVEEMASALLSKFKDKSRDFLPQLEYFSLELPCVTLNMQLVERILEVAAARQRAPHPFSEFRLVRITDGTELDEFVMGPELIERIRVLEESGVKVVVTCRPRFKFYNT